MEPSAPSPTLLDDPSDEVQSPAPADTQDNDSWRQKYTLGDESRLSTLSRYKTEDDFIKSTWEAKDRIRERDTSRLPDNATPEQLAEYRKANGVPDDASGYGLTEIDGVELSEVEKGMIGNFQEWAHEKNLPSDQAREIVDFYLNSQDAAIQGHEALDEERNTEWQKELESEFGKDFKNLKNAAAAYLEKRFGENESAKAELLNARLPGGGRLGNNPDFFRLVTDMALESGLGDAIEASEMESSSGKSLAAEQKEIEDLRVTDPAKYNLPETQQRLDKIYAHRLSRGEINENGDPVPRRK